MLKKYVFFALIFSFLYSDTHKEIFTKVYESNKRNPNEKCLFENTLQYHELPEELQLSYENDLYQILEEKITHAQIEIDPFPHLVINNFFPLDYYEKIMTHLFDASLAVKTPFSGRKKINLNTSGLNNINVPLQQVEFWHHLTLIANQWIKPLIAKKFLPYLSQVFPDASPSQLLKIVNNLSFHNSNENAYSDKIYYDTKKFKLHNHVDLPGYYCAILFYLGNYQDEIPFEIGTKLLYGPNYIKAGIDSSNGGNHCTFAKNIPYQPNTLAVILRTPWSWHTAYGSSLLDDSYIRHVILFPLIFSKHLALPKEMSFKD